MSRRLISPQRRAGPASDDLRALARQANNPGVLSLAQSGRIGGAAVHVRANAQVAALLLGLPSASEMIGRELTVKKIDPTANTVTVRAYQAESIDGAPERVLAAAWSWLTVRASAANSWDIIAQGGTVS
jgi:hypothetical protein